MGCDEKIMFSAQPTSGNRLLVTGASQLPAHEQLMRLGKTLFDVGEKICRPTVARTDSNSSIRSWELEKMNKVARKGENSVAVCVPQARACAIWA